MSGQVTSDLLILPGDPRFYETLGRSLPVGYEQIRDRYNGEVNYIARPELGGTLDAVSSEEAREYLLGGEYDLMEELNEEIEQEYYINCPEWMR